MKFNSALLGDLEKLDPELYQDIYEMGFRICSWPENLIMGMVLEAIDKMKIPIRIANEPQFPYLNDRYSAQGRANDVTKSDYMEGGDSWAEAVLKLYLQILRRK